MSEKLTLVGALGALDIDNDDHWTSDGLPRIDVLEEMTSEKLTRAQVTEAAKGFTRKTPNLENEKPENMDDGSLVDADETEEGDADEIEENEETEEPDTEEALVDPDEKAVEDELDNARKVLAEAQARYQRAVDAMDVVIQRRNAVPEKHSHSHQVKAYQESQRKQREQAAKDRERMADLLKG